MKVVRFALVAFDTTPLYENEMTPTEEDIQKEKIVILARKDLLSRRFVDDAEGSHNEPIEDFESQLKKFITPELLNEMVNQIEELK